MKDIAELLANHPHKSRVDLELLAECIRTSLECAQTCTCCADACLGEEKAADLTECIRATEDCASVCRTSSVMFSRLTSMNFDAVLAQAAFCADVCRGCAEACEQHREHHDHCAICAEVCRECERACRRLAEAAPVAA